MSQRALFPEIELPPERPQSQVLRLRRSLQGNPFAEALNGLRLEATEVEIMRAALEAGPSLDSARALTDDECVFRATVAEELGEPHSTMLLRPVREAAAHPGALQRGALTALHTICHDAIAGERLRELDAPSIDVVRHRLAQKVFGSRGSAGQPVTPQIDGNQPAGR